MASESKQRWPWDWQKTATEPEWAQCQEAQFLGVCKNASWQNHLWVDGRWKQQGDGRREHHGRDRLE